MPGLKRHGKNCSKWRLKESKNNKAHNRTKMIEKLISTLMATFMPFVVTYISMKNKSNVRKYELEKAHRKLDFMRSYIDVSGKLLSDENFEIVKKNLSVELQSIYAVLHDEENEPNMSKFQLLNDVQKFFLTFMPITRVGWLMVIIYYVLIVFITFGLVGLFLDENNNYSIEAFLNNENTFSVLAILLFYSVILIIVNRLALKSYKKQSLKESLETV